MLLSVLHLIATFTPFPTFFHASWLILVNITKWSSILSLKDPWWRNITNSQSWSFHFQMALIVSKFFLLYPDDRSIYSTIWLCKPNVASLLYQRLHCSWSYWPTPHADIPDSVNIVDLPLDHISVSFTSKQKIHFCPNFNSIWWLISIVNFHDCASLGNCSVFQIYPCLCVPIRRVRDQLTVFVCQQGRSFLISTCCPPDI